MITVLVAIVTVKVFVSSVHSLWYLPPICVMELVEPQLPFLQDKLSTLTGAIEVHPIAMATCASHLLLLKLAKLNHLCAVR